MTLEVRRVLIDHRCKECGHRGEVPVSGRKVTCPACHTVNDWWLDGEEPPERHRNDERLTRE